jgi:signal transduction histidine kinase
MLVGETTEIDILRKGGGTVVAELRVVETQWEGEKACVISLRDITDRRMAEEKARQLTRAQAARAEAEAAEQRYRRLADEKAQLAAENEQLYQRAQEGNRAKSEFLAVMSHELRTPLNAIIGYTDLLAAGLSGPVDDRQRQQLQRIEACSHHLLELVDDILSFSRLEAGKERLHLERVDFSQLVREVADLTRPAAERKQLRFRVDAAPHPIRGESDPGKVRQILVNLLSNAIKFTDEGEVRLDATARDGEVRFKVSDTGIGIPEDRMPQIWDPFWQVQQSRTRVAGGTGLGLSVVRRLTELLGGRVDVESRVGSGTTFSVVLPMRET